jgi:hypothetical protein
MRPGLKTLTGAALIAPALLLTTLAPRRSLGDEPGRLGRLFRFGNAPASAASPDPRPAPPASTPFPSNPSASLPAPTPMSAPPPGTASPRIVPQPRVSRPVTEAEPLVTRVSLNRSDDGNAFGMFLQVFADGTVIDGEGAHHVTADVLKPVVEALQSNDFSRLKGHCGGPSTDYVEQVHVVVYERTLGRLRANAFSYSGNPQGCDHAVRHLHTALDTLQTRISRPITAANTASPMPAAPSPFPPHGASNVITLTPGH